MIVFWGIKPLGKFSFVPFALSPSVLLRRALSKGVISKMLILLFVVVIMDATQVTDKLAGRV